MTDSETNNTIPGDPQPAAPAPSTPGAQLAASRESHGWTVEQVASYLKLAPRQVVAIERDDYEALPGMPIVRGFVRSYAKLLKIDAAPLLAQLGGETVLAQEPLRPKESLSTPFSEARLPSMSEKPAISSKWMIGVLLLALLVAAIWAFRDGTAPAPEPAAAPIVAEPAAPAEPEPVEPVQTQPAEPSESPEAFAPSAAEADTVASSAAVAAPPAEAPLPPVVPAEAPAAAPAAAPTAGDTLSLTVREESWVEIRRAGSGNVVMARLAQPGENISVEVGEPVVLVVGNAAGVDATLRGEPVPLKSGSRTNVARLTLK